MYKVRNFGITKTTLKDVAKQAIAAVVRESEEANEELLAGVR